MPRNMNGIFVLGTMYIIYVRSMYGVLGYWAIRLHG